LRHEVPDAVGAATVDEGIEVPLGGLELWIG
jgi:hypothetical protein